MDQVDQKDLKVIHRKVIKVLKVIHHLVQSVVRAIKVQKVI